MSSSTRLPARTRLAYGSGLSADGIKNFLLFCYQQIVGLDALLCGLALLLTIHRCGDGPAGPRPVGWIPFAVWSPLAVHVRWNRHDMDAGSTFVAM
jgi:hypothetical protein